jgi:hypothetical protein
MLIVAAVALRYCFFALAAPREVGVRQVAHYL